MNSKPRILYNLRRINHLMKHDYGEHNHPVSKISDSAQHVAGKKFFCKLDCFQAYHCIQRADEQSVRLLSFIFVSRTFASQRLAQVSIRSSSTFTSVISENWDPVVEPDRCAQYVNNIGVAAYNPSELIENLSLVLEKLQNARFKLSIEKCQCKH